MSNKRQTPSDDDELAVVRGKKENKVPRRRSIELERVVPIQINKRSECSEAYWKSLTVSHPNILTSILISETPTCREVIYSKITHTLKDLVTQQGRKGFWISSVDILVGITPFFIKVIRELVVVTIFLNTSKKNLSHQNITLDNVVFSTEDMTTQLRDFSRAGSGGQDGLAIDLTLISNLIDDIISNHEIVNVRGVPLEIRSLKTFLKSNQAIRSPELLLKHPALLNSRERRHRLMEASNYFFGDPIIAPDFEAYVKKYKFHNLDNWKSKLEKTVWLGFGSSSNDPSSLVKHIRYNFENLNNNRGRSNKIPLEYVSDTYQDLFPNLLVFLFGFMEGIEIENLAYW